MNRLFVQQISLRGRLTLALVLAFLLLVMDLRLGAMEQVRMVLNSVVSPVQYMAAVPEQMLQRVYSGMRSRSSLQQENETMQREMLELRSRLQRYDFLNEENARLRSLLAAESHSESTRMVAEVIAVDSDPFSQQVVINKGLMHGAFIGQPVLDDRGVLGQIASIGATTARVILISDSSHAIPARTERSGIRVVAQGIGETDRMELVHVPHSTELEEGELLFSSALGGVFPEGYPVAVIKRIRRDESLPFAQVEVTPVAQLDRVHMVLLLWSSDAAPRPLAFAPERSGGAQ